MDRLIRSGSRRGWVGHVTEHAVRRGVTGTPTVKVNGKAVDADRASIAAAIAAGG